MSIIRKLLAVVMINAVLATAAFAGGTEKEAQAMLDKAMAYIKDHGTDAAYKAFSDLDNKEFHDKDIYIFAYDLKGVNLAHGANPKLVGKNLIDLKDANGKLVLPPMIEIAKTKGSGTMEYMWSNPETKKLQTKLGFVRIIPGHDAFIGSGVYR